MQNFPVTRTEKLAESVTLVLLTRWTAWFFCWAASTLIVFVGAEFGYYFIQELNGSRVSDRSFIECLVTADGLFYRQIADAGYSYNPAHFSNVAFFPAYPLLTRWVSRATGWETSWTLLLIANACTLATFFLLGTYLRRTRSSPDGAAFPTEIITPTGKNKSDASLDSITCALLALGLSPFTFFFRMPYSEPLFLCIAIFCLYAIAIDWPLWAVCVVVGLGTATRPVGISLLLPFALYVVKKSKSLRQASLRLLYLLPLSCWGLLGYIAFQYMAFGHPFAFGQTQENLGKAGILEKLVILLSWEPIRNVYNRSSLGYWQMYDRPSALFSMQFLNPIFWTATGGLIFLGALKRWLNAYELLLSIPLILIPYVTLGSEVEMNSHARYAAAVLPVYIVLGNILSRMPAAISAALLALSASLMAMFAALFITNHSFF